MPEWTPEDVELVAGWFKRFFGASVIRQRDRDSAVELLAALAEAGRLAPPGAAEEWAAGTGYLIRPATQDRRDAEAQLRSYGTQPGSALMRRWVGPWQPVEPSDVKEKP